MALAWLARGLGGAPCGERDGGGERGLAASSAAVESSDGEYGGGARGGGECGRGGERGPAASSAAA